jgi:hypothetical protein
MRLRPLVLSTLFLLLVAGLAAAFLTGAPQRAWDSARLVANLAGQTPPPAGWVVREQAFWQDAAGGHQGTLYRPVHRDSAAAMVLVPGADMAGDQHPLFVRFAETLASAGFLVLVPDIASLRRLEITAADAEPIAGAVRHMASRPEGRNGVAVTAISYAVGPAVLAALTPGVSGHVAAILGIGGYYDSFAAATFFTTGGFRAADGRWRQREPANHGRWVFLRANASLLPDVNDRAVLLEIARLRAAEPAAPVGHLVALLGPEGRAVWKVLENADPERASGLLAELPAPMRAELASLDLSQRDLSALQAELILVHGRDDPVLPHTESVALAAAAPRAKVYLLDSLRHVDLDLASLADGWRLFRAGWDLMSVRDRLEGPSDPPTPPGR